MPCHGHHTYRIAESGHLVGLFFIKSDTQFLVVQFAEIRQAGKDADAAGECCGLCYQPTGTHAHVVGPRSSHSAHRYHYGLFGVEQFHLPPKLFRGVGVTAPRVDAQHHRFHVVIVS